MKTLFTNLRNALFIVIASTVLLCGFASKAQAQSQDMISLPDQSVSSGSQTGAPTCMSCTGGRAWSTLSIVLKGTITTVTFAIQGSNDGGLTWVPVSTFTSAAPTTLSATQTATTNGVYYLHVAGLTHIRFVTSGTFTGTNVKLHFTGSTASYQ